MVRIRQFWWVIWWSIGDVKIILGEDPEGEAKEIRELLGDNAESTLS